MGPLEGIKVVELGTWILAPATSAILAEMGADVVKIEEPVGGDPSRGTTIGPLKVGPVFVLENRNKKSLALNLATDEGKEIAHRLIATADVFISNMPEEVLARLGMDYETLTQVNPALVYAWASAYGRQGPEAGRRNFDVSAFWTRGGFMHYLGEPDSDPPAQAIGGFGDHVGCVHLALGVVLALYHRQRTGEAQRVDISLLGTGVWTAALPVQIALLLGFSLPRGGRKGSTNPLYSNYCSRDGKWFQIALLQSDRHWPDLCRAMGRDELVSDPRFDCQDNRMMNNAALVSILDEIFATRDMDEWAELFERSGIFWDRARDYAEIANDPQVLANDYIAQIEDEAVGPMRLVAFPVQLEKSKGGIRSGPPEHGHHTEELVLELGYTWEDIARFKERQAIL
ncbi:MAG: CoA transferase [Chloroflexota bacterium]|nr:CoA transferase [Chloroflexota bacterium]